MRPPDRSPLAVIALSVSLAGCLWGGGEEAFQGYVEGVYVYVAPEVGGRIAERPAGDGATVAAGDPLFRLDEAAIAPRIEEAEARLAQAEAQLANLVSGKRPEEIAVIEAGKKQAEAAFTQAEKDFDRNRQLFEQRVVSQAAVDAARERRDVARARLDEAESQLAVAALPAREEEIQAARRNRDAVAASLAQLRTEHAKYRVAAPVGGLVARTYFEPGEVVPAGQPVASLLPPGNRKILFFVPEAELAAVSIGQRVRIGCDSCRDGLAATVTFVATEAEFTPPVIYSTETRGKLVFRVEARPEGAAADLKVGQPVDVRAGASR